MNSELKRKTVHIGSSGFAFLLRWLNWWQSALIAFGAFIFNFLILPRVGGKNLYRDDDHQRGHAIGIFYTTFCFTSNSINASSLAHCWGCVGDHGMG